MVAELVVVWGVLGILVATTGLGDSPLAGIVQSVRQRENSRYGYVSLDIVVTSFALVLLY